MSERKAIVITKTRDGERLEFSSGWVSHGAEDGALSVRLEGGTGEQLALSDQKELLEQIGVLVLGRLTEASELSGVAAHLKKSNSEFARQILETLTAESRVRPLSDGDKFLMHFAKSRESLETNSMAAFLEAEALLAELVKAGFPRAAEFDERWQAQRPARIAKLQGKG